MSANDGRLLRAHSRVLKHCGLAAQNDPIICDGKWDDVFDLDNLRSSAGSFGQVFAVKGKSLALKMFQKPASDAEKTRIQMMIVLADTLPTALWPSSLVRYRQLLRFSLPPHDGMLMDFVAGRSMQSVIDAREIQLWPTWIVWLRDTLAAINFLHRLQIVHRDVHPGNIIIKPDGKHAVLVDLDLLCTPTVAGEQCKNLCFDVATPQSTAPDVWCIEDVMHATASQLQASDVWATAAAFVSLASLTPMALARSLQYTKRGKAECQKPTASRIDKVVEIYMFHIVQMSLQRVMRAMLHSDWRQRPFAADALAEVETIDEKENLPANISTAPRHPLVLDEQDLGEYIN